jgi:CRP/FNR family transcriptional regulator
MASRRGQLSEGPVPWLPGDPGLAGIGAESTTGDVRTALTAIGTIVAFDKGTVFYRQREKADFLYIVRDGVVRIFTTLPEGSNRAVSFCFQADLFGIAENERYTGSAEALLRGNAYQIPVAGLDALLPENPELARDLLQRYRQHIQRQQQDLLLLGRGDALGRVAMFVATLERSERTEKRPRPSHLYLPMSRSDIADFVALSLEAVSRAFGEFEERKILTFRSIRHFQVTDRAALQAIIDDYKPARSVQRRRAKPKRGKTAGG